ncbi:MAG: hypothetical protein IPJ32_12325 [Sphingobacteriaceae bacterium]|nr:hypothetical protein [Sphingobacteriaceae bacterium]
MLFQIKAQFPNECNYPAIQDKECHIGITGDMVKLSTDEKTLQILADNSTLLYPISADL